MSPATLGLLHPGAMGATVGAAARASGTRVLWSSAGRSDATKRRAAEADLEETDSLATLAAGSGCIACVCPPEAARDVAAAVAATGFAGTYLDANAVAPDTARAIGAIVSAGGARFVDGGIVGPPARRAGTTRLYLSGDGAAEVAALFAAGPLEAIPIEGDAGAASALKMAYAAWTKGTAALLAGIRALARREGVDDALLAEWSRSQPDLPARSEGSARATAPKAWRFASEMEEIAASFAAADLPDGFHRAAAEIYRRLAPFKDADPPPELEAVLAALRGGGAGATPPARSGGSK